MDFLLASYRKQKKWIHLRQILLLLSRLAIALLLIALLCGWSGGRKIIDVLGGNVTHHVIVLDDSYSMGDQSLDSRGGASGSSSLSDDGDVSSRSGSVTAYSRALSTLQDLTRYLANQDGEHQVTVMRASRALMSVRAGSGTGDSAADLSSQTVGPEARLINRLMATSESSTEADLVPAIDLASELLRSTPADEKFFYILSDFRERSWGAADRISESLRRLQENVPIRLVDCAAEAKGNLAITQLTPTPDVWVAGVPVMMRVAVKNYGIREVKNVPLTIRMIRYPDEPMQTEPALAISGEVEALPDLVLDAIGPGEEVTRTFQVFIAEQGTHAIEALLPGDALEVDNRRFCTLPLSAAEKVLIIDGDLDGVGAYHVASSLNPGGQVDVGAVPEIQPPSFLRSISYETLSAYRAIYLIDLPEITDNAAAALDQYVMRGGGLSWFIGNRIKAASYNQTLVSAERKLLPAPLSESQTLVARPEGSTGDVVFGEDSDLFGPLKSSGDGILSLVGVTESWGLQEAADAEDEQTADYQVVLKRNDGRPLVMQHRYGEGRVLTSLVGLDGSWTNWPSDPTFVVFLLQSNAWLWSAASPPVSRAVDAPYVKRLVKSDFLQQATFLPPTLTPPRVPFEVIAEEMNTSDSETPADLYAFEMIPDEMLIRGDEHLEDVMQPGLSEWAFVAADGTGRVVPQASVIQVGDGDLVRAEHASVLQQLAPMNVQFVQRRSWNQDDLTAGSSTMALVLLLLLIVLLLIEQGLAYWASYHVSTSSRSPRSSSRVSKLPADAGQPSSGGGLA